jgi:hypothetical protein
VALSPVHDFRTLDASHGLGRTIRIRTQEQAALYNLPIGSELLRDVGWQLPSYLAARDIPTLAMVHVKPSSAEARVLRDTNDYHEEFHLRGRPFVVHQRGSHKHPFRSMPLSAPFYAAIESYPGSLGALASEDPSGMRTASEMVDLSTGHALRAFGAESLVLLAGPSGRPGDAGRGRARVRRRPKATG